MSSPIETLIDRALGLRDSWQPPTIWLQCPTCFRSQEVQRHAIDPDRAKIIQMQCPDCDPDGSDRPRYSDARGREVPV